MLMAVETRLHASPNKLTLDFVRSSTYIMNYFNRLLSYFLVSHRQPNFHLLLQAYLLPIVYLLLYPQPDIASFTAMFVGFVFFDLIVRLLFGWKTKYHDPLNVSKTPRNIPALHEHLGMLLIVIEFSDRFEGTFKKNTNYELCYDSEHRDNISGDVVDYKMTLKYLGDNDGKFYFYGYEDELHKIRPFTQPETKRALRYMNKDVDSFESYLAQSMDFKSISLIAIDSVNTEVYPIRLLK